VAASDSADIRVVENYAQGQHAFKIQAYKFNLGSAITVIEYQSKLAIEERKFKNDSTEDEGSPPQT
jgi:hypothetical protein